MIQGIFVVRVLFPRRRSLQVGFLFGGGLLQGGGLLPAGLLPVGGPLMLSSLSFSSRGMLAPAVPSSLAPSLMLSTRLCLLESLRISTLYEPYSRGTPPCLGLTEPCSKEEGLRTCASRGGRLDGVEEACPRLQGKACLRLQTFSS